MSAEPGERGPGVVTRVPGSVVRAVLLGLLPVALAAGLWRLERDRPAWVLPGSPQTPFHATVSLAALPRLVLAVHYPWYGTPGGPAGGPW